MGMCVRWIDWADGYRDLKYIDLGLALGGLIGLTLTFVSNL